MNSSVAPWRNASASVSQDGAGASTGQAVRRNEGCSIPRRLTTDRSTTMAYLWMLLGCFSFAWMGQFAGLLVGRCDWRIVALARAGLVLLLAASIARTSGARLVVLRPPALWMRSLAGSV